MADTRNTHTASFTGISSAADATDVFALIGGTGAIAHILEIRIWQIALTAVTNEEIIIVRGTGGATGVGVTEYDYWAGDTPILTAVSNPGTDVATGIDLEIRAGWNVLQPFVWLPTPQLQIPMKEDDDLGISFLSTTVYTTLGCQITWEETPI